MPRWARPEPINDHVSLVRRHDEYEHPVYRDICPYEPEPPRAPRGNQGDDGDSFRRYLREIGRNVPPVRPEEL